MQEYTVDGTTYAPEGYIRLASTGKVLTYSDLRSESLLRLAEIAAICNDAKIIYNEVLSYFFLHVFFSPLAL